MNDPVNHPSHYTAGKVECIDAIESALGDGYAAFLKGQVIKYLWRAGRKDDELQDFKKANFYMDRLLKLKGGEK